jgi:hypothetical protein
MDLSIRGGAGGADRGNGSGNGPDVGGGGEDSHVEASHILHALAAQGRSRA